MFLKTGELKKLMRSSLKKGGLTVGNVSGRYLVYSGCWGVYMDHRFASNKFKAAIIELVGELPEPFQCLRYTIDNKELQWELAEEVPDPYGMWKRAKDIGAVTGVFLTAWPHEYMVFQRKSDRKLIAARRGLTADIISASELDASCECMPGAPCILNGSVLYFKNESMIYWVHTEPLGTKVQEVLFPQMECIDFFENDWIRKTNPEDGAETADESPLPY